MWKEAIVALLTYYPSTCLAELRKTSGHLPSTRLIFEYVT
jgi:hypothetical protein